jgi:colanic acid biosynthesis glycosyl transferase WcaI
MRILILGLNHSPEQVGIGLYTGDMARALAGFGHQVELVAAHPYYPAWKTFKGYGGGWKTGMEGGVRVTRCPIYVPATPSGLKRILHHASFAASAAMPMLARAIRFRPEIVFTIAPSLIAAPLAHMAGRAVGAKNWLHVQDFEVEAAFATGLMGSNSRAADVADALERYVLTRFDVVSSISPKMCEKLVEKGVASDRVVEFRNWADIASIRPLTGPSVYREEWGIKTAEVALYSGNIANKQGIEIVLDAARLLAARDDLTFIICGNGPNRGRLAASAEGLPNIQFRDLQPRERLSELVGLATVHLLPQLAEAADLVLPSKLTNMLASGRPVVATATPGTGLAVEVEGCGVITPPGDAQAFADGISALVDDPNRRAVLGAEARRRAEQVWAKDAILERLDRELSRRM